MHGSACDPASCPPPFTNVTCVNKLLQSKAQRVCEHVSERVGECVALAGSQEGKCV